MGPRVDLQLVVEERGLAEGRMRLEHERLDALVAELLIPARVLLEKRDARNLEPDEVVRVVCDTLRVGLGEPHSDLCGERVTLHWCHRARLKSGTELMKA